METSFESFPVICKSIELCTLCPWLFPKVIPRMIEPLEFKSPKIWDRVFLTKTPSSIITLFGILIKSKVSLEKTSFSIFAARMESFLRESFLILGFCQVKICPLIKLNAQRNRIAKNIFLNNVTGKHFVKVTKNSF